MVHPVGLNKPIEAWTHTIVTSDAASNRLHLNLGHGMIDPLG